MCAFLSSCDLHFYNTALVATRKFITLKLHPLLSLLFSIKKRVHFSLSLVMQHCWCSWNDVHQFPPTIETLYPGNQTDDFSAFKHVTPLHATFKLMHESDDCNEMQSLVLLQIMHTAETMQLHCNSKYELVHEHTTAFQNSDRTSYQSTSMFRKLSLLERRRQRTWVHSETPDMHRTYTALLLI